MPAGPQISESLNRLLADSTVFYQKLRHYHWNVTGPQFFALHIKFEELYGAWAERIDQVAERILTVGGVPIHTLRAVLDASSLEEDESLPAAEKMVTRLLADLMVLRDSIVGIRREADESQDDGTADLMDQIRDDLEKDAWMLRAFTARAE